MCDWRGVEKRWSRQARSEGLLCNLETRGGCHVCKIRQTQSSFPRIQILHSGRHSGCGYVNRPRIIGPIVNAHRRLRKLLVCSCKGVPFAWCSVG